MTWRTRALRFASVAVFSLLLVLATLAGFRVEDGIESSRISNNHATRYEHVRLLVTGQEAALNEFGRDIAARQTFDRSDAELKALLHGPGPQNTTLRHAYDQYSNIAFRYMGMLSTPALARRFELNVVDIAFDRIDYAAGQAAEQQSAQSSANLNRLDQTQQTLLVAVPVGFALAGGLLLLLATRRRRAAASVTQARTEIEMLDRAAHTDSLTGLANHRVYAEVLETELQRARADGSTLSLLMLDLDDLKLVNDTLGHQRGDEMLREVAAGMQKAAEGALLISRMGGDEFTVLVEGASWEGFAVAERILEVLDGKQGRPGVAIGVGDSTGAGSAEELVHRADLGLIAAKRSSRQVIVYTPDFELDDERQDPYEERHVQLLASSLARAVDAKDSYTRSHSDTVSALCALVAGELGLEEDRIAKLRVAGLLHDVGKIGTPDRILNKPGKLTDAEYEEIKKHPVLGAEIVNSANLGAGATWIRHHHERIDGGGYPDGLAGDQIPLESRIILVADAFEALTSDRPYRRGRETAAALEEIERNAGSQFDRDCVDALRQAVGYGETRPSYQSIQPPQERDKGTVFSGSVDVAASSPR